MMTDDREHRSMKLWLELMGRKTSKKADKASEDKKTALRKVAKYYNQLPEIPQAPDGASGEVKMNS